MLRGKEYVQNVFKKRRWRDKEVLQLFIRKSLSLRSPYGISFSWNVAAKFQAKLSFSWYVAATYQVKLRKWLRGLGKTLLMGGVQCFLPLSMDLGPSHAYRIPILQKESIWLSFSSHRTIIYKSPPHIGGCHFLLCQHTSKKDIAGQSATGRPTWKVEERGPKLFFNSGCG